MVREFLFLILLLPSFVGASEVTVYGERDSYEFVGGELGTLGLTAYVPRNLNTSLRVELYQVSSALVVPVWSSQEISLHSGVSIRHALEVEVPLPKVERESDFFLKLSAPHRIALPRAIKIKVFPYSPLKELRELAKEMRFVISGDSRAFRGLFRLAQADFLEAPPSSPDNYLSLIEDLNGSCEKWRYIPRTYCLEHGSDKGSEQILSKPGYLKLGGGLDLLKSIETQKVLVEALKSDRYRKETQ